MFRRVILLLALAIGLVACGDDDAGEAAASTCDVVGDTDAAATSELAVSLDEWTVEYDGETADAGSLRLAVKNDGEVEHELVIEPAGGRRVGEIEPFASGTECDGTFALPAGTYRLFCEIVDESGTSHRDAGMIADLIVK